MIMYIVIGFVKSGFVFAVREYESLFIGRIAKVAHLEDLYSVEVPSFHIFSE
jgi:hypothetical protein